MRVACPTPVSVMEEAPSPRSVGTYRTPVYARARVSKGFTIRKPSLCYPEGQETPLSPSTNLRGISILQRKSRSYPHSLRQQRTPRSLAPTTRLEEVPTPISRDISESCDWGSATESEWEGDDPMQSLSVTGRNPATSDSNVTNCHNVRLPELQLPSKTRSAVQQSRMKKTSRRYSLTPLPVKTLNVGGFGLPFPTEPPCSSGKDYKPGRVVNTSFDCFRCEHRMSVHDNHQWLKSILISSRLRKTRRLPNDNRYSKGDLNWALFPRYWSNQYLEPEPEVQAKTPDTRPMTQTPDTVSGPWRGDNSRSISIINGQLTREDLEGFCGKRSCQSKMDGKDQPVACRAYKSDTHLGANVMTYGDVWCHSADVKDELMSRQNSRLSENGVRETTSMTSQCDKTSRLSVYSREGLSRGRSSAFEIMMRIHCPTPEDVYLELHEDTNTEEGNYHEEPDGLHAVRMDYSLRRTQERSNWNHSLGEEEMRSQEEVPGDYPEDQDQRCVSLARKTPSWCSSRSSVVSEEFQKASPCDFYNASAAECFEPAGSNWYGAPPKQGTLSQIDCNTSAVERCPALQARRKKAPQGQHLYASPINPRPHVEEEGFLPHHHWQHSVTGMNDTFGDESTGAGAKYSLDNNQMIGLSDPHGQQQPELYNEEEEEEDDDDDEEDEDAVKMLQSPHSQFLLKMRKEMNSRCNEQPYPELPKPLGKYFCYAPIVDKRYNRWKRRRPKKRKRVAVKVHTYGSKTSTSTSNESTAVGEEEASGRDLKKGKHYRRNEARLQERKTTQQSTDDAHPEEVLVTKIRADPVVDQSDWTSADETQFPDSTEACTDSSKSSLTSRSSGSNGPEPRLRESFIIPTPVTFVDMEDLCPSPTKEPSSPEIEYSRPEPIIEQARARSRVASIPSKNCPRTQKSLLSLSLRGPTLEKEMDPMQALPRAGCRLPLLKTQREELARSADRMSCTQSNTSCLNKMQRRLGWIKRGILQQNSNKDLKLSAEKYVLNTPRQSPVSRPRISTTKPIPRQAKVSREEKFSTIVQGQKKQGPAQKKHVDRHSSGQGAGKENLVDKGSDTEDNPSFTLKDLLSTLPDSDSDPQMTHRKTSPSHQLTSFFASGFVTGSFLHKRKLKRRQVDRSISTLSFTPAFTFSVYTLPHSYRSRNNNFGGL